MSAWMGLLVSPPAQAQAGTVQSEQKISEAAGGFAGTLDGTDQFGNSVAFLGDLDGDGVTDMAVGARGDDDGGTNHGAVWILFLDTDGTVKSEQKISSVEGGFGGALDNTDHFGWGVGSLGDLDGDGVEDLAVGAIGDDDGASDAGALWILFLETDGTVKSEQKISNTTGGFGGTIAVQDNFGCAVSCLGDLDGDGIGDLAVGAYVTDDGSADAGAVWILFLDTDGTVKSEQKISATAGGFGGVLDGSDLFGWDVGALGDLDGDGVEDLAVGARQDDDGDGNAGAVWILFLDTDGTVQSEQKISDTVGGLTGDLDASDFFGSSVASLADLNGDGIQDLAVGARQDDDGSSDAGAVWILFLDTDGTVKSEQKISATEGGFGGSLAAGDLFGTGLSSPGDLDGDGFEDLGVGAMGDDDGGGDQGACWILFLGGDTVAPVITCPSDLTEECASSSGAVVTFDTTATDDHDPDPDVECVPASGTMFPLGTTTVTCTATDLSGNSSMCMFDVTVEDTVAPVIDCPGDLTVYFGKFAPAEGGPAVAVAFSVDATDTCDPSPSVVCNPPSGSMFDWGTTTVTCTAEDADGNTSMCSFDVVVRPRVGGLSGPPGGTILPGAAAPGGVAGLGFEPTQRSGPTSPEASWNPTPLVQIHRGGMLRQGSGSNPKRLVSPSEPFVGRDWTALVDVRGHSGASSILLVSDRPLTGVESLGGELLVDVAGPHLLAKSLVHSASAIHAHELKLEPKSALQGRTLYVQAVVLGEEVFLTNAIDLPLGR